MTKPSSSSRLYSRFIPREEVDKVTQWEFGSMGSAPEPEAAQIPNAEEQAQHEAVLEQAREAAWTQGHAQGHAEASLLGQQRLDDYVAGEGAAAAQRLAALATAFEQGLAQSQQMLAQGVLDLACDIARQVVRRELHGDHESLRPVIQEALAGLVGDAQPTFVRLNPVDEQALAGALRAEFAGTAIQWVADPDVEPGGCLVEQAGCVIDGSLQKRWQRALASLGREQPWQPESEHANP